MSKNPWPLLLVGLGSFGFLAASMAQQTELPNFSGRAPTASIQFSELDEPDFRKSTNNSGSRWSDDGKENGGAWLGGDIEAIKPRPPVSVGERLGDRPPRFADRAEGRIRDTWQETAQAPSIPSESSPQRSTPRFNLQTARDPARERFAERDKVVLEDTGQRPSRGPLFNTRETAILGDPPGVISANRSPSPEGDPTRETDPVATENDVELGRAQLPSNNKTEDEITDPEDAKSSGKLPLWSMALFASVAANVVFCWIAWDAHSKYQDLVEDMSESDTRLERQTRRLRNEDAPARRIRDVDDSDFLRAGVEA